MFSKELSAALQHILNLRNLNCETASELCDMSVRHFGNIIRCDASPTLDFFEKLCVGLGVTPNELLGYPSEDQASFRRSMPIVTAHCFHEAKYLAIYGVCPRCGREILQDYSDYCCNCGQALSWDDYDLNKIKIIEID